MGNLYAVVGFDGYDIHRIDDNRNSEHFLTLSGSHASFGRITAHRDNGKLAVATGTGDVLIYSPEGDLLSQDRMTTNTVVGIDSNLEFVVAIERATSSGGNGVSRRNWSDGQLQWWEELPRRGSVGRAHGCAVAPNGDVYAVAPDPNSSSNDRIYKFDAWGNEQWVRTISRHGFLTTRDMAATNGHVRYLMAQDDESGVAVGWISSDGASSGVFTNSGWYETMSLGHNPVDPPEDIAFYIGGVSGSDATVARRDIRQFGSWFYIPFLDTDRVRAVHRDVNGHVHVGSGNTLYRRNDDVNFTSAGASLTYNSVITGLAYTLWEEDVEPPPPEPDVTTPAMRIVGRDDEPRVITTTSARHTPRMLPGTYH